MARDKPCKPEEKGWFGGGLGKEDKKFLTDLKGEVVQLRTVVSELAKVVGQGKPIDIRFSWPLDHELMQIVKDIQARLPADDSVTKEQIDAHLREPVAELGQLGKE